MYMKIIFAGGGHGSFIYSTITINLQFRCCHMSQEKAENMSKHDNQIGLKMCQLALEKLRSALQQCQLAHHPSSCIFAHFCDFSLVLLNFCSIEGSFTINFFEIHIDCQTRGIRPCLSYSIKKKSYFSKKFQDFSKSCIHFQTRGIRLCPIQVRILMSRLVREIQIVALQSFINKIKIQVMHLLDFWFADRKVFQAHFQKNHPLCSLLAFDQYKVEVLVVYLEIQDS